MLSKDKIVELVKKLRSTLIEGRGEVIYEDFNELFEAVDISLPFWDDRVLSLSIDAADQDYVDVLEDVNINDIELRIRGKVVKISDIEI